MSFGIAPVIQNTDNDADKYKTLKVDVGCHLVVGSGYCTFIQLDPVAWLQLAQVLAGIL